MASFTGKNAEEEIRRGVTEISEEDIERVLANQDAIEQKFRGPLARFMADAKLFFQLIRDYLNGSYREVPWLTVAAISVALLYVLNPIDLFPDFIPGVGLVDDALVIGACLKMISRDLDKYVLWRRRTQPPPRKIDS